MNIKKIFLHLAEFSEQPHQHELHQTELPVDIPSARRQLQAMKNLTVATIVSWTCFTTFCKYKRAKNIQFLLHFLGHGHGCGGDSVIKYFSANRLKSRDQILADLGFRFSHFQSNRSPVRQYDRCRSLSRWDRPSIMPL